METGIYGMSWNVLVATDTIQLSIEEFDTATLNQYNKITSCSIHFQTIFRSLNNHLSESNGTEVTYFLTCVISSSSYFQPQILNIS